MCGAWSRRPQRPDRHPVVLLACVGSWASPEVLWALMGGFKSLLASTRVPECRVHKWGGSAGLPPTPGPGTFCDAPIRHLGFDGILAPSQRTGQDLRGVRG